MTIPHTAEDLVEDDRLQDAVAEAMDAFWASLAENYPELDTSDIPGEANRGIAEETVTAFDNAAVDAAVSFVIYRSSIYNKPK